MSRWSDEVVRIYVLGCVGKKGPGVRWGGRFTGENGPMLACGAGYVRVLVLLGEFGE